MPWSDHSDDDGVKPGGSKPGSAKPGAAKPGAAKPANDKPAAKPGSKAGAKPGPWGAPTPPAPSAGPEIGSESGARRLERESPRKPPVGGPRKPPNPPTSDDLTIMLRRWRQRLVTEVATLQSSGAAPRITAVVVGAVVAFWAASGYYRVQAGEQAVVTTFGAYSRTTSEGPNYRLPAPFEQVSVVSTSALQAMDIGSNGADDPRSLMLTNDGNIVAVNFAVHYRIADPKKYLFDVKDPNDAIRGVAEAAIREAVGRTAYAQVLGGGHAAIQGETRARIQSALNRYGAGVNVVDVQIIAAGPPREVGPANQAVVASRQAVQAALTDANGAAAKAANDARSTAAKARADAEAYSARMVSEANADANRFAPLDAEYRLAPAVTEQRIYTETMERILSRARVVIDARGATTPLILPQEPYRPHGPTVEAMTPGGAQ